MDDFEQQLKKAMARTDPPAWFEAKVLAAARQRRPEPKRWRFLVAALASLLVVSGVVWQQERERKAGEEARAKLELALRITSEKLQKIEADVGRASARAGLQSRKD